MKALVPTTAQEPHRERQRSQGWGSCQAGEIKTALGVTNCIHQQFRNWIHWPIYQDKPFPECQEQQAQTAQQSSIDHASLATSILQCWKTSMKCIIRDPQTGDLGTTLNPSHASTPACRPPPPHHRRTWLIHCWNFPAAPVTATNAHQAKGRGRARQCQGLCWVCWQTSSYPLVHSSISNYSEKQ